MIQYFLQRIAGRKIFNSLVLSSGIVNENVDIPKINNLDIKLINRSIVWKDDLNGIVINGSKTFFYGLEANHLIVSFFVPNKYILEPSKA